MRRAAGILIVLLAAAACSPTPGSGGGNTSGDKDAPVISNIVVAPDPVLQGSQMTVTWRLTDATGVAGTTLLLRSTTTTSTITACATTVVRTSGTALDGTYSATCNVPTLQPSGPYYVDLGAIDSVGNSREDKSATFSVSGTAGDTDAPLVVSSSLGLTSTGGQPIVTATLHVTDQSGVAGLALSLKNHLSGAIVGLGSATLLSGTTLDGNYSGAVTVLAGAPSGSYDVILAATDTLGNAATTTLGTIALS